MERDEGDSIRLTVPADPAAVRIARVGATGLGTRLGFSYVEVEELRQAVGEAAALLTEPSDADELVITYEIEEDGLRVDLRRNGNAPAGSPSELQAAVLDGSVDDWRVDEGGRRVVLHKRRSDIDTDDD